MKEDRRSAVKKEIISALLIVILIALIGGTFARYTTPTDTFANIQVAKWSVKVTNANEEPLSTTKTLDFVLDTNANVKDGRIAPASSATATAKVNMTGTEVAAILTSKIDSKSL